jgi:glucokinase
MNYFLAGDIGGTSTRLALYLEEGEIFNVVYSESFLSSRFSSLEEIVTTFLSKCSGKNPQAACFGVPGPVVNGTVSTTNLPWQLNERSLEKVLQIRLVKLVNDLASVAYALPFIKEGDLLLLHEGKKSDTEETSSELLSRAVIAPGTGLGQASLVSFGNPVRHLPLSSEGGHVNFAPTCEEEWRLFEYLIKRLKRVSVERVVSGPGIYNIYAYFRDSGRFIESPEYLERIEKEPAPKIISDLAINNRCEICVEAMDLFARVLMSHAGNIMLTMLASGGVYLGGGIPPKIKDFLNKKEVVAAFYNKGRLTPTVEATNLFLILNELTGLDGAARFAASLI